MQELDANTGKQRSSKLPLRTTHKCTQNPFAIQAPAFSKRTYTLLKGDLLQHPYDANVSNVSSARWCQTAGPTLNPDKLPENCAGELEELLHPSGYGPTKGAGFRV